MLVLSKSCSNPNFLVDLPLATKFLFRLIWSNDDVCIQITVKSKCSALQILDDSDDDEDVDSFLGGLPGFI